MSPKGVSGVKSFVPVVLDYALSVSYGELRNELTRLSNSCFRLCSMLGEVRSLVNGYLLCIFIFILYIYFWSSSFSASDSIESCS